jgi:hypothetical protein
MQREKKRESLYLEPEMIGPVLLPDLPECERAVWVMLHVGGITMDESRGGPLKWMDEMPSFLVCETEAAVKYFVDTRTAF